MKAVWSLAILAVLLVGLMVPHAASAALTSSWQIITKEGGNTTNKFEAKDIMNITVLSPQSIPVGGVRSLIVWSTSESKELTRYSLGYYPSGSNQSAIPRNLTINLGAFPQLIHGDTLLLQIRSVSEAVEYTTAVTVAVDVDALLKQQADTFYGLIQGLRQDMAQQNYAFQMALDSDTKYIEVMAVIIIFLAAYTTKDMWYGRKKATEQVKSEGEFEQFLEALIVERHSAGDKSAEVEE